MAFDSFQPGDMIGFLPADQDMQTAQFQPVFIGAAQNTVGHGQGGAAVSLNTAVSTTANTTSGSPTLSAVANTTGFAVGQTVTGAGIPANTTITAISGSNITLSQNATATATGVAISSQFAGTNGNVPLGILVSTPRLGEAASVVKSGVCKVKAVGTWAIGDFLTVATGGAVKATSGSGKYAFARALESAVNGDTSSVLLGQFGVQ